MHYLAGLSLGYAVPRNIAGQVHSVFDRACNILLSDGALFSLFSRQLANAPLALRLDIAGGLEAWFVPGQPFVLRNGSWRSPQCQGSTHALPIWQPERQPSQLSHAALRRNVQQVQQAWCDWQQTRPLLALPTVLLALCQQLQQGIAQQDTSAVLAFSEQLLGWGQGLTPSGDDVLVACLAVLWRWREQQAVARHLLHALQASLPTQLARTHSISQHYLRQALAGQFSEPLEQLLAQLLTQTDAVALQQAVAQMLAQGASSGADGLYGVLLTLQALLPPLDGENE
ncbi:DUF2877 domain-containing protein [Neisseriaceae bacterium TC5R-5]|nr:DUF2877 domain-containing protein [Neisseriaceae bacterium TC5R-5]